MTQADRDNYEEQLRYWGVERPRVWAGHRRTWIVLLAICGLVLSFIVASAVLVPHASYWVLVPCACGILWAAGVSVWRLRTCRERRLNAERRADIFQRALRGEIGPAEIAAALTALLEAQRNT